MNTKFLFNDLTTKNDTIKYFGREDKLHPDFKGYGYYYYDCIAKSYHGPHIDRYNAKRRMIKNGA